MSDFRLTATPVRLSPLAELKIAAGEDSTTLTTSEWETWVLESPLRVSSFGERPTITLRSPRAS